MGRFFFFLVFSLFIVTNPSARVVAQADGRVSVLDQQGDVVTKITDGDRIRLRFDVGEKINQDVKLAFELDSQKVALASCTLQRGDTQCESALFDSLGWHWNEGAPAPERTIYALGEDGALLGSGSIQVAPRPVVMVHGFSSNWEAWANYLGPDGYLASIGVPGFAVGDGQVAGEMNTGDIANPAGQTNTIAENAAILGEYIDNVKKRTGAEKVDLLAHSMGGMISRYYIARLMNERDVAQLMMLGSPAAGTDCANLPASLGFYLPATLEIRPSYANDIFNPQITQRKGVPFFALAGTSIQQAVGSPCADIPSDIVISEASVSAIPLHLSRIGLLHIDLNTSAQVFDEFVKGLLEKGADAYREEPDPLIENAASAPLQFSRVFNGRIEASSSQTLTIPIDPNVTVASFALYDPTRSLKVTVRGASGKVIELDPVKNGLIEVDDPRSLVYLGYGFANPKPGSWQVTLEPSQKTPSTGADYALTARFTGGAVLQAASSNLIPAVGEPVQITAKLELDGQSVPLDQATAAIRAPDGSLETLKLAANGDTYQITWSPSALGLYGIDVETDARSPDGSTLARTAFLTLEAQPQNAAQRTQFTLAGLALLASLLVILVFGVIAWLRRRARWARR